MNCFRFFNVINNATTINTFNSDDSDVANIKTQHRQTPTTITNGILIFESMIKKTILVSYTSFTIITFTNINYFPYINPIVI